MRNTVYNNSPTISKKGIYITRVDLKECPCFEPHVTSNTLNVLRGQVIISSYTFFIHIKDIVQTCQRQSQPTHNTI